MPNDYEVGYGKPPKDTRFKKGRSGNPRGRPKSSRNLKTVLLTEQAATIAVRVGKRVRRISKLEAMAMRMMAKALEGDVRSAEFIAKHTAEHGEDLGGGENVEVTLSNSDKAILQRHEARVARRLISKGQIGRRSESAAAKSSSDKRRKKTKRSSR